MTAQPESSTARICTSERTAVGAGFLVDNRYVLACAQEIDGRFDITGKSLWRLPSVDTAEEGLSANVPQSRSASYQVASGSQLGWFGGRTYAPHESLSLGRSVGDE